MIALNRSYFKSNGVITISIQTVSLKCQSCNHSFRVLEDEQFDHHCPDCGPQTKDEHEGIDAMGDEIRTGDYILEHNGEIILLSNAADYLVEHLGAVRKMAGE